MISSSREIWQLKAVVKLLFPQLRSRRKFVRAKLILEIRHRQRSRENLWALNPRWYREINEKFLDNDWPFTYNFCRLVSLVRVYDWNKRRKVRERIEKRRYIDRRRDGERRSFVRRKSVGFHCCQETRWKDVTKVTVCMLFSPGRHEPRTNYDPQTTEMGSRA